MHTLGDYSSTLPPNSGPGRSLGYSEQTVQVTSGNVGSRGGNKQMCIAHPTSISPQNSQFRESLFFRVLFSFDLDLCVTAGSRLTRLIVNLSPNSNPDIYHGLISVQIRVQQNWNIIEVTPNLSSIFHRNVFIWIAVMLCAVLCVEMSLCVSPVRL